VKLQAETAVMRGLRLRLSPRRPRSQPLPYQALVVFAHHSAFLNATPGRPISITLDVYFHATPAMEEEAAAKIAALFMPG